ncbi:MAG TPA: hypothetical protein PKE16_17410 [Hyphomicrobium sp.]|nr:hypothetical protein [Hyphomicrobium sp.]
MTQLYFHIGDTKTGSSSIQYALFHRLWKCESTTLAYPPSLLDSSFARTLYTPKRRKDRDDFFQAKADWLAGVSDDIAVFSAEQFSRVEPDRLDKFVRRFMPEFAASAKYLAYVRPHAGRIVSRYAQRTKSGKISESLEQFTSALMGDESLDYIPRFQGWKDTFADRLIIRPMIREELYEGDVVKDFFNEVLEGREFTLDAMPQVNESSEIYELGLLNYVQDAMRKHGVSPKMRVALGGSMATGLAQARGARDMGGRLRLSRNLAEQVMERYMADARRMDDLFFDGRSLMVPALQAVPGAAVADPQIFELRQLFDDDKRRDLDEKIVLLANDVETQGLMWKSVFMSERGLARRSVTGRPDPNEVVVQAQATEVARRIDDVIKAGIELFHPSA